MASQEKITVYNLADLKNTSDDAIPNYLNSLKFTQSHTLTDVRLALGYGAFVVAAGCFLWDYKLGFDNTKYYTAAAVALYAVLNGALTLWIWGVEKGTVYVGTAPSGEKVSISSSTAKNDPSYHLTISVSAQNSSQSQTITVSRAFAEWFDGAGHFIVRPFQTMLATSVPAIGKLDSKRLAAPTAEATYPRASSKEQPEYSAEMLDAVLAASVRTDASASATGSVSAKKGGKRRKA